MWHKRPEKGKAAAWAAGETPIPAFQKGHAQELGARRRPSLPRAQKKAPDQVRGFVFRREFATVSR